MPCKVDRGQVAGIEITATESSTQLRRLDSSVPSVMSRERFWEHHKNPFYLSSTGGKKDNSSSLECAVISYSTENNNKKELTHILNPFFDEN